ncbi:hypothetical protein VTN77DRAFT_9542 [Rasamsonia byssochlamydoides]|uniref:uncharacterized protein n=1 Tax=Rasamsonia byssochlamydoides TaxID=89139 RepID=UPI003742BCDE
MLDPISLKRLEETPFWNLAWMEKTEGDSGGTFGYIPEHIPFSMDGRIKPWSAADAKNLSLANPNRTGLYFRDEILNTNAYPWSTIGRVDFKRFQGDNGGWCTASLVGSNLILTASHCFPWGFNQTRWMRFAPGYRYGNEPYGGSFVSRCRGVRNTSNVTGIDYIVCHLCEPLGETAGWMGTRWWAEPKEYMLRSWRSSGYPADSLGGRAQMLRSDIHLNNVDLHFDKGHELESDIYASAGWSGGPMWGYVAGVPKIVGVCSGSEKDCSERVDGCTIFDDLDDNSSHDVSAGGRLMSDLIAYAMAQWADE